MCDTHVIVQYESSDVYICKNLAQLWNPICFPFEAKWPGSVYFACFTFVHLTVHDSWWKYFQTTFRFWQWINCHLFPLDEKLSWTQLNPIYHPHDFLLRGTGDSWFIVKSEMWFGSIPSECGCFRFKIVLSRVLIRSPSSCLFVINRSLHRSLRPLSMSITYAENDLVIWPPVTSPSMKFLP